MATEQMTYSEIGTSGIEINGIRTESVYALPRGGSPWPLGAVFAGLSAFRAGVWGGSETQVWAFPWGPRWQGPRQ